LAGDVEEAKIALTHDATTYLAFEGEEIELTPRMTRADLTNATFVGSYLQGANLAGAKLSGANFSGAQMDRAVGLTQGQLSKACGDETTTLPHGLHIPACK